MTVRVTSLATKIRQPIRDVLHSHTVNSLYGAKNRCLELITQEGDLHHLYLAISAHRPQNALSSKTWFIVKSLQSEREKRTGSKKMHGMNDSNKSVLPAIP